MVGSNNGILYALNKDDGSEVWAYAANDKEIRSSPLGGFGRHHLFRVPMMKNSMPSTATAVQNGSLRWKV